MRIVDGTSINIPLSDKSVDGIVVAQAFHWFDNMATLKEVRVAQDLMG